MNFLVENVTFTGLSYHIVFWQCLSKNQKNQLAVWTIRAVVANDLFTDDSFVVGSLLLLDVIIRIFESLTFINFFASHWKGSVPGIQQIVIFKHALLILGLQMFTLLNALHDFGYFPFL